MDSWHVHTRKGSTRRLGEKEWEARIGEQGARLVQEEQIGCTFLALGPIEHADGERSYGVNNQVTQLQQRRDQGSRNSIYLRSPRWSSR